jgi:hypothetical protein
MKAKEIDGLMDRVEASGPATSETTSTECFGFCGGRCPCCGRGYPVMPYTPYWPPYYAPWPYPSTPYWWGQVWC